MRKLFTILLILPSLAFSQVPGNDELWDAVDKYIGKKVGDGVCYQLRDSVLMDAGLGTPDSIAVGYHHFVLNEEDHVMPGDLIVFKDAVIGSSIFESHVAIVYSVKRNKLYVVHQNVDVDTLEDSRVIVTLLNMKAVKSGSIEFHRVVSL